jgi:hypothetical protein
MDVGFEVLDVAGRADHADRRSFGQGLVPLDRDRAQMDEGHRVAGGRLHRDRAPPAGDRASEAHDSRGRSTDRRPRLSGNVDAAVLAAGVRVVSQREWS